MTSIYQNMPITVSAAVRRENKLLFVKDAYGEFKGLWTFPAGYVDEGEQPDVAAVRETREEAGVICEVEGLVSVVTITWRDKPMLYLVFLARYVSGEPQPDQNETEAADFLGLDEIASLPFDSQNAFLAQRILTNEIKVLSPYQDPGWHSMYRSTFV